MEADVPGKLDTSYYRIGCRVSSEDSSELDDSLIWNPAAGNQYLGAQNEFIAFTQLYARYEVVGMKAETTLNARCRSA